MSFNSWKGEIELLTQRLFLEAKNDVEGDLRLILLG